MRKNTYNIARFAREYDSERKGAKWAYYDEIAQMVKYGNGGELYECGLKFALGMPAHKDPNGSYDSGSDIEETQTSVKSWGFTLATIKADNFEDTLEIYWSNVASTNFSFGWIEEDELVEYNMNADEFNQFLYRFCKYDSFCKAVRGPKFSMKKRAEIEKWFAERA